MKAGPSDEQKEQEKSHSLRIQNGKLSMYNKKGLNIN